MSDTSKDKLIQQMKYYKSKLTDKYNRSNSYSRKIMIARELIKFSTLYKELLGHDACLDWDQDESVDINCCRLEYDELIHLIDHVNENEDFYKELSSNVLKIFQESEYPFYKYYNGIVLNDPRLDKYTMLNLMLSFLKSFDYDIYEMFRSKFVNNEVLSVNISPDISGFAFSFPSINKSFMFLNNLYDENLFKYETLMHEFGHIFEIQLVQDSNNNILLEKGLSTPYSEISSCFFQYAFINYLKENKIYTNYVNQCLDMYYKDILAYFMIIRIISEFPEIEVGSNGDVSFLDTAIIEFGDKIKEKLNYYELLNYEDVFEFRNPYIYGMGHLISLYLYENYKTNPNFIEEFKKALLSYPLIGDITAFEKLGITKEELVKCDVLKKVLKKQKEEIVEGE